MFLIVFNALIARDKNVFWEESLVLDNALILLDIRDHIESFVVVLTFGVRT